MRCSPGLAITRRSRPCGGPGWNGRAHPQPGPAEAGAEHCAREPYRLRYGCRYHPGSARRIADLAQGADALFIESVCLRADADQVARKLHLTARQAGQIARSAGARAVVPFHLSPRYAQREAELRLELEQAFRGG